MSSDSMEGGFAMPIRRYLDQLRDLVDRVDEAELAAALGALCRAWDEDRTVFIAGNGGSAATATHMVCDLTKQTQVPGRRPLRALSLADNVASLTAFGNDLDYTQVFSEQLNIHARTGDLLICISCSGASPNILAAIAEARRQGMTVLGFGGFDGGEVRREADVYVHVPSYDYGLVETIHVLFDHCLTALVQTYGTLSRRLKPAVLIDRDGVLLRNREDYVKSWAEAEVIPGSIEAVARLSRAGHRVFVVTNQSAVGRGLMSTADLDAIHTNLAALVADQRGHLEGFLTCPHLPEAGCDCRKPKPGLLHQARDNHGVELGRAYFVGDFVTDIEAADAAGCTPILVLSGRHRLGAPVGAAAHVLGDLADAAEMILAGGSSPRTAAGPQLTVVSRQG
ncbi:MAG: HAD-IIIA family hydrolase [Candidatus Dormibacteraceae bacterium]